MTSEAELSTRLSELIGDPVVRMASIGGGTFGRPFRATTRAGDDYFVKVPNGAGPSPLAHEARSLRWLAEATADGGAAVAAVIWSDAELLVLRWLPAGTASAVAAAELGRALALTHAAGADRFGGVDGDFIASEPLPAGSDYDSWPMFYAEARLRPFLERAATAGSITGADQDVVAEVIERIAELSGQAEPPARLHGDLWSGNVLWTDHGAVLIDPSAHGGHRETDLAMLDLFGLPHLAAVVAGYQDTRPLAAGWQDRISLHQLYPLLVHATLFGGHYGRAAGNAARQALAAGG